MTAFGSIATLCTEEAFRCLQSVQIILTLLALILGGVWTWWLFVRRRQRFPRAELRQEISDWRLADGRCLVRVSVSVVNRGDILLSIEEGLVRLQRMVPWPEDELATFDCSGGEQREIDWPLLEERKLAFSEGDLEIEPGEQEVVHVDFLIPGDSATVLVYSYVRNRAKRDREIGWSATSVYPLACQAPPSDSPKEER